MKRQVTINKKTYYTRFGFAAEAEFMEATGLGFPEVVLAIFTGLEQNPDTFDFKTFSWLNALKLFFYGIMHGDRTAQHFASWQQLADELDDDKAAVAHLLKNFLADTTPAPEDIPKETAAAQGHTPDKKKAKPPQ